MSSTEFDTVIERFNSDSMKFSRYADRQDVIPLWVADMDFAAPAAVQQAVKARAEHPIYGYASAPKSLSEALCAQLQKHYGWTVDPVWFVWVSGVVPALSAACRAVGQQGDQAIISSPIYHHFLSVVQPAGREKIDVPLLCVDGRWQIDFDGLERAAANPRAKLLLLCSPHNPVGRLFDKDELRKLVDIAARHGLIVVSDEIHNGLVLDEEGVFVPTAMAAPEHNDRIMTLLSPSKTFNIAGINCSVAIVPDAGLRRDFANAIKGAVPGVSPFAFVAAEAAFRDCDDWLLSLQTYLRANRDLLQQAVAGLPRVHMPHVEATYLGWINVAALQLDNPTRWFEAHGLGFSPGAEFGNADYVRWNFACRRAVQEQAIERFAAAVRQRDAELA